MSGGGFVALAAAAVLVVSLVPTAQAAPSAVGEAQLVALDGNTIAHTIRYANGNWQPFGHLDVAGAGGPTSVMVNGEEHLFFDKAPQGQGALTHYIRHADGTWDLNGSVPAVAPDQLDTMSVTSVSGRLVLGRKQGDDVLVSTQQADGSWSAWDTVPFGSPMWDVSLTADGGTLRVASLTKDAVAVLVENRAPDGTWTQSPGLNVQVFGPPIRATGVVAAQVGMDLQVVVPYSFGSIRLWHAILPDGGSWSGKGDIEEVAGDIPSVTDVVAASSNGSLQVAAATANGLFHTIRHADGNWDGFGDVRSVAGPVTATRITLAADNG